MKNILYSFIVSILFIGGTISIIQAKEVVYNLDFTTKNITINNNKVVKFLINGVSKAPVLRAKEGDVLTVIVNNKTKIPTTIHWHGLLVPNSQDGVAEVTQPIIQAQSSYTYKFTIKQTGTYWYHAHGLEEASGLYGAIVLNDSKESILEGTIVQYSGLLDKNPDAVLKQLQGSNSNNSMNMAGMHSMGSMKSSSEHKQNQSEVEGNHSDHNNISINKKDSSGSNKSSMNHFSDVTFYKHLINGDDKDIKIIEKKSKQVKLRIINSYVDGFLNLVYSGGDITIIASDGIDVKPLKVTNLRVAMGETYDILLDVQDPKKSYELVSFILGTKDYKRVVINSGKMVSLPSYDYNKYSLQQPYNQLESITPYFVNIDKKQEKNIRFDWSLVGNHSKYNWAFQDNKSQQIISSLVNLPVGSKVTIKLTNNTMMPHPMHLHGMFFKVKNAKNNLIKHTYNLDPNETMEIEFTVDDLGKWLFHCHNLFHMASGMMVVFNVTK